MIRLVSLAAIAVALTPVAAHAQSMNAELFYKRATALKSKGPIAALVSRDLKPLVNEARAAGLKARSNRLAAAAKGIKPRYCPPTGSKRLGHDEFLKGMSAIPAVERIKIDMTEAMNRVMAAKFPCRKQA